MRPLALLALVGERSMARAAMGWLLLVVGVVCVVADRHTELRVFGVDGKLVLGVFSSP